jgi:hypothetical protein
MKLYSKVGLSERAIAIQRNGKNVIHEGKIETFHVKTKHIDILYHFVRETI